MRGVYLLICLTLFPMAAEACRGLDAQSHVFLKSLPRTAFDKNIIMFVEVIEDSKVDFQQSPPPLNLTIAAIVLKEIKGKKDIESIKIKIPYHTCYQGHNFKTGEKFFIAGDINDDNLFEGEWRNEELYDNQTNTTGL